MPASRAARPLLVAIVGGSGSGKSRLAARLADALGAKAGCLSLDDFYLDRSHLSPARRARINFDHPRTIDWPAFESALRALKSGRSTRHPVYDFATHSRQRKASVLNPKPVILVDGLWLLHRPPLRRMFTLGIFLDCPARVRLGRRLARDLRSRGRTADSIRRQFRTTVEPMHRRYVAPQAGLAGLVLKANPNARQIKEIISGIESLLQLDNRLKRTR